MFHLPKEGVYFGPSNEHILKRGVVVQRRKRFTVSDSLKTNRQNFVEGGYFGSYDPRFINCFIDFWTYMCPLKKKFRVGLPT